MDIKPAYKIYYFREISVFFLSTLLLQNLRFTFLNEG